MSDLDDPLGLDSWSDELDRDAVGPALAAFYSVLGQDVEHELILTSDLEGQVRERLEPEAAAAFEQDRGDYGLVSAKTLRQSGGPPLVIFDVRMFLKGSRPAAPTFRHEALHVLLIDRGESTFDAGRELAATAGMFGDVVAMAAIAAEEYRVQRATYSVYREDPSSSFEALCVAAHNEIHDAAIAYYFDPKDVMPLRDVVIRAFAAMSTQAGYIAAQLAVEEAQPQPLDDRDLHARMLGGSWPAVIAELQRLPPADTPIARSDLDAIVLAIASRFETWLEELGFGASAIDETTTYFHVYEHRDWVQRNRASTPTVLVDDVQ